MVSKKSKMYRVMVTGGDGSRRSTGARFKTKAEAKKEVQRVKKSKRVSADTKNPRIQSYIGFN